MQAEQYLARRQGLRDGLRCLPAVCSAPPVARPSAYPTWPLLLDCAGYISTSRQGKHPTWVFVRRIGPGSYLMSEVLRSPGSAASGGGHVPAKSTPDFRWS